ncbi:MAG: (2Fe-2S)-binding protein [Thiogranum sp.]|nr:(2Fe-2S)-binding protein [Thiogranum sp.]
MYVCICNAVTDRQIREARDNGACTIEELGQQLRVATCCGRCAECAQSILSESAEQAA